MSSSIHLRNVLESDLEAFYRFQADSVAHEMAAFPPRQHDAFMVHWRENVLANHDVYKRTVLFGEEVAGYAVCFEDSGRHMVGYWIGREYWRKGIATLALRELITDISTRPLYAIVFRGNIGSTRVLEKCGFARAEEPKSEERDSDEYLYELR